MLYVLKYVTPDGRKGEIRHHYKQSLEDTRKEMLKMGFLRATVKKAKAKDDR